jgi:hypothetical protein
MSRPVAVHDMQAFAESLSGPEVRISSDVGNVIDIGPGDTLGDDMGFSLLSNTKVTSSSQQQQQHQNTIHVSSAPSSSSFAGITLEPLEAVTFDIPMASEVPGAPQPEISVHREGSSGYHQDNTQTASGPGIQLSSPTKRLSPEEESREKADMINKLSRLEAKGFTISKRFTMDNTHEEIKQEMDRLMDARNLEGSIKFQRQMMMGVVTGLELMNNKFNPFDWQLDGWSESIHENVDDYDEVFEELYDKYKTKGNMPPEARLLFMMVGSGFMFHMSNSFFRQKMGNVTVDDILKNNPALAKQMAAAAAQAAGPGFGNFMGAAMGVPGGMGGPMPPGMGMGMPQGMGGPMPNPGMQQGMSSPGPFFQPNNMPNQPMAQQQQQQPPVRREMKGPSGVDDILQTFKEVRAAEMDGPPPLYTQGYQGQQTRPPSDQSARAAMAEIASVNSDEIRSQAESTATAKSRKRRAQLPVGNSMSLNV